MEQNIQKGFTLKLSGKHKQMAQIAHIISNAVYS